MSDGRGEMSIEDHVRAIAPDDVEWIATDMGSYPSQPIAGEPLRAIGEPRPGRSPIPAGPP